MYKVYVHGKRYGSKVFSNYEQARSYARKLIRKGKFLSGASPWNTDFSDLYHHNPSLSFYGITIRAEKF